MPVRRLDRLRAAAPWIAATLMVAGAVHLATILLMGTLAALLLAYLVLRARRRGEGGSALDDQAGVEM